MKVISVILFFIAFILIMAVIKNVKDWRKVDDNKTTNKITVAIFVPVLICFIFIMCGISTWSSSSENASKTKVFEPNALKKEASLMSHHFLQQKLKVPVTAKYPVNESKDVTYHERDSVFYVDSYLDSKNSNGALLRESYYAKMKYKGKGNWICLKIELIEQ